MSRCFECEVQQFFEDKLNYRLAKTWQLNFNDQNSLKLNIIINFPQTAADWLIYVTIPGFSSLLEGERIANAEKNFEQYSKFFPKAVNL